MGLPCRRHDSRTGKKEDKIADKKNYYSKIIRNAELKIEDIVCVSSLAHWGLEDGKILDPDEISDLTKAERERLKILKDYRYNIDELYTLLLGAIQDPYAQMGLRMAARLDVVVLRLANYIVDVFSALSGTIALTPIPVSDIYFLYGLQVMLIFFIAALSGRDITWETAKEFVISLFGVGGIGLVARVVAQQLVKLANLWKAGTGSAISAAIASLGTKGIGAAAISYYINSEGIKAAKERLEYTTNMDHFKEAANKVLD